MQALGAKFRPPAPWGARVELWCFYSSSKSCGVGAARTAGCRAELHLSKGALALSECLINQNNVVKKQVGGCLRPVGKQAGGKAKPHLAGNAIKLLTHQIWAPRPVRDTYLVHGSSSADDPHIHQDTSSGLAHGQLSSHMHAARNSASACKAR